MATYAEAIKALLRIGFKHKEILDLCRDSGKEEVLKLGEDAIKDEEAKTR